MMVMIWPDLIVSFPLLAMCHWWLWWAATRGRWWHMCWWWNRRQASRLANRLWSRFQQGSLLVANVGASFFHIFSFIRWDRQNKLNTNLKGIFVFLTWLCTYSIANGCPKFAESGVVVISARRSISCSRGTEGYWKWTVQGPKLWTSQKEILQDTAVRWT